MTTLQSQVRNSYEIQIAWIASTKMRKCPWKPNVSSLSLSREEKKKEGHLNVFDCESLYQFKAAAYRNYISDVECQSYHWLSAR